MRLTNIASFKKRLASTVGTFFAGVLLFFTCVLHIRRSCSLMFIKGSCSKCYLGIFIYLLPPTIYLWCICEIRSIKKDKAAVWQNFFLSNLQAKIQNLRTFREFSSYLCWSDIRKMKIAAELSLKDQIIWAPLES